MNETPESQNPLGPSDEQIARMRISVHASIAADQVSTRRRRGWGIGGTLGLLVLLAGGTSVAMAAGVLQAPPWLIAAPAPTPSTTPSPIASASPTPSQTPTPAATPTATPVAFNLPCDQQLDPAVLASVAPGLKPGDTELGPPTGDGDNSKRLTLGATGSQEDALVGLAAAQTGLYSCTWGDLTTQKLPIWKIQLSVLPEGTAQFETRKAYFDAHPVAQPLPAISVGDEEFAGCDSDWYHNGCRLDLVEGDAWVAVTITPGTGVSLPPGTAAAQLGALAGSAVSRIFAPGLFFPPPGTQTPTRWATVVNCSAIGSALGLTGYTMTYSQLGTSSTTPLYVDAVSKSGAFDCSVSNSTSRVTVVPGAAAYWDVPYNTLDTVTPLDVSGTPGVDKARLVCPWHVMCWTDGIIDGAVVSVLSGDGPTGLKMLGQIAAALPPQQDGDL